MTSDIRTRVGRWAAALAGVLVAFKSVTFIISRIFRVARGEVQSRGSDVTFVVGMAERGRVRIRP